MKVFLDDIKKIGWLATRISEQKWGSNFLNLKRGFFFVFNYNLVEKQSSIQIVDSSILYEINDSIYRNMSAEHIGYMQEPFDSSNYLFYSILKSACQTSDEEDKLTDIFISYKSIDLLKNKEELKISLKGVQDINSNIDFSSALNNIFSINKQPLNGLVMVYDLIDGYVRRTFNKSIYGQMLSKIVKAVKNPNGGLLPEYASSNMRYLIIGEVAAKDDAKLKIAKILLRSGNSNYNIYLETGWYFNKFDNKWRKRISDDTFYFDNTKLISTQSGQFDFIPEGISALEQGEIAIDLVSGKKNMANVVANGYNGRLGDYISFKEAYDLYPKLKDIYSVLSVNNILNDGYSFYFTPQIPYSLVLIAGKNTKYDLDKVKYVALHEIQHYVQTIEGFGSGGNDNLANLVSTVGGSAVKMFFISLSEFQKKFSEVASLIPLSDFNTLSRELGNISYVDFKIRYKDSFIKVNQYYDSILKSLRSYISDSNSINNNSDNISYYILSLYSMIPETNTIIDKFVKTHIGEEYIEFFNSSLQQNKKTVEKDNRLSQLGWRARDLYILNFQIYESLIGEVEARFTQQTSKLPKELKDYFEFYTSETIDSSKVNVINNSILVDAGKIVEAALETYGENEYVIHLPEKFSNSINLLHETAHILYDFVKEDVLANHESIQNALLLDYTSVEEYFCASFVDYIHRKDIDPMLSKDLGRERQIKDLKEFDNLFESILYSESNINEGGLLDRLGFLNKLLENI